MKRSILLSRPLTVALFICSLLSSAEGQTEPGNGTTSSAQTASATSATTLLDGEAATSKAIADCAVANSQSEFDTGEDVLARSKSKCQLSGRSRIPARGGSMGDLLKYDADSQTAIWQIHLDTQTNLLASGGSPYMLAVASKQFIADHKLSQDSIPPTLMKASKGIENLTPDQEKEIMRVGNSPFALVPLYGSSNDKVTQYEAGNAYGATTTVTDLKGTRYSLAIPASTLRDGAVGSPMDMTLVSFPIAPAKAREQLPALDVEIDWIAIQPCSLCNWGGSADRSPSEEATISSPYKITFTHKFVYAKITAIKLIDRRDGSVVFTQSR